MEEDPPSPTRADLARELLRYKMEDYLENGFCASWLVDLEFELSKAADEIEPDERRTRTVEFSRECRVLADIAGGLWAWDVELPGAENPVFITLDRWQKVLAEHDKPAAP